MKAHPSVELFLSRFAEGEWLGVVRPWLERGRGRLERALLVAPTRGHTHALKQRCLVEGVALLGVEFLTPGLARRKRAAGSVPGRGLELLLLRSRIEDRLAALGPDDPASLVWRSLASDLDAALDDFYDLIRGGFRPEDFPRAELRVLFGELAAWIGSHGYALAPQEDEAAGLGPPLAGSAAVADRILILAGGAENWRDFFGLAALARRSRSLCVSLAEPEFGGGPSGESWVEVWQALLGVEAAVVDAPDPQETCSELAGVWIGDASSAAKAEVIVGRSAPDEMERVADALAGLLGRGADNVAVIFPGPGAAHERLARLLDRRGVAFADMIGSSAPPPLDTRMQHAIVDFYERGCRLEELLALWPLLRALNLAAVSPERARAVCAKLFDSAQSHGVEPHLKALEGSRDLEWREVGRVARLLLPSWPVRLTFAQALDRFEAARDRLMLGAPPGWAPLREFAKRADEPMHSGAILEAIRAFLPEKGPAAGSRGRSGFAHVTLTTARRAAGVAWSHAVFVEANRGIWPERRESSCWLDDEARRELNLRGRFSLGLPTGDERATLERRLICAIARDTRSGVVFSASVFDDEDPGEVLEPNDWLERVMWRKGLLSPECAGPEAFGRVAGEAPRASPKGPPGQQGPWIDIWRRRRDPSAPFDEFFFSDPDQKRRPASLSASLIQRGIGDPVCLWFEAVLGVRRVEWRPFGRARRKSIGEAVHGALAAALRGTPLQAGFFRMPGRGEAEARLAAELAALRARWPSNRYWDSFHLDVSGAAGELLDQVFSLPAATYAAVEAALPDEATVPAGIAGRLPVRGRVDLVLSDLPGWSGARVEIADFKTGADAGLSPRSMASRGASLQLGVYLEAARSVGASGAVWMLKPGRRPSRMEMDELEGATAKLGVIGRHLASGAYGALTPDRDEYTPLFEWPLACAPIASVVLRRKFALTFGAEAAGDMGGADE